MSEYAFPIVEGPAGWSATSGMSLRDYFAAKAMQGFAADPDTGFSDAIDVAELAYEWADAMLQARGH